MKIRAIVVQRRLSDTWHEPVVDGRLEIQWKEHDPWLSIIGIKQYYEPEWYLIMSIMQLGARQANVNFEHIDKIEKNHE